jgi:aryl-alcohol dehydrogenase-like predicted oxidoreductase
VAAWRLGLALEITHIDTAELYGDAEEMVAEAIAGRREEVEQGTAGLSRVRPGDAAGARSLPSRHGARQGSRRAAWRSCATPRRGA